MKTANTVHSAQEGRTIIETLAYIMVMISVTAGIATVVSRGYYRYECSAIQQDLVDLHKAITKHYAIDGQYSRVHWDDLCEDKLGPKSIMPERVCSGEGENMRCWCKHSKGQHIFEGEVDIGKGDCSEEDVNGDSDENNYCATFYIEFKNLPRDVCAQLGTKSWTTTSGSDLERMIINNTLWYWEYSPLGAYGGYKKHYLPASVEEVAVACHDGYNNTIRWYFN